MQVYDAKTDDWVRTPKEYGKVLPSSELVHGFRRFFPSSEESPEVHTHSDLTPAPPSGLPAAILLPTLKAILADVKDFLKTVENYEWRVAGGSLLIAYEGQEGAPAQHKVKMIDFAHARHLQGEGPDEGLLKGVHTIIRLLEGRIQELENLPSVQKTEQA
jgi:1D-myo-inositol-tetrakisphosphate 5-kinase/inositol-polyphosphate multikinase